MTSEDFIDLLNPISESEPTGADFSFSAEFDAIRMARKSDDTSLSQGDWVTATKTAQWQNVVSQCEQLLRCATKDFQVAAWYADALTRERGFSGLNNGLCLLAGLCDRYWESAYPRLQVLEGEAPDLEERAGKIEWLDAQLPAVIRTLPMTAPNQGGYGYFHWEESRQVENLGLKNPDSKAQAIAEGKLPGDRFDRAVKQSGASFYRELIDHVAACQQACAVLEHQLKARFGENAPLLAETGKALAQCYQLAQQLMVGMGGGVASPSVTSQVPTPSPAQAFVSNEVEALPAGPVHSRQQAVQCLWEVAQYFRRHEPHSPVAPLVERAARWADMSLDLWLSSVIKDTNTLGQLKDLLDLQTSDVH